MVFIIICIIIFFSAFNDKKALEDTILNGILFLFFVGVIAFITGG